MLGGHDKMTTRYPFGKMTNWYFIEKDFDLLSILPNGLRSH